MPVSKEVKEAVLNELQKDEPLMDIEGIKQELLDWLAQIPFPAYPGAACWEDCLQAFPAAPEEKQQKSGISIRLTLPLYTRENKYLIAIMESLDPASRGVYFLSMHVNWKSNEWRLQKALEEVYTGQFDDALKAKHTIWAQTFQQKQLHEALNGCALAILGQELAGESCTEKEGESVEQVYPTIVRFPRRVEE